MKKKFVFLLLALFIIGLCSAAFFINSKRTSDIIETYAEEIVTDEQYFKITKTGLQQYNYYIYDVNGNTVEKQIGITNLSDIKLLNDNVVDININWGTGLAEHRYYSVYRNSFSEKYMYVVAYSNEKVAYLDGSLDNRRLIVENAFDKNEYYNEYNLEFSALVQPVIDAAFINDCTQLQITYFSDKNDTEGPDILDLY